jgi:hypothetical protein
MQHIFPNSHIGYLWLTACFLLLVCSDSRCSTKHTVAITDPSPPSLVLMPQSVPATGPLQRPTRVIHLHVCYLHVHIIHTHRQSSIPKGIQSPHPCYPSTPYSQVGLQAGQEIAQKDWPLGWWGFLRPCGQCPCPHFEAGTAHVHVY